MGSDGLELRKLKSTSSLLYSNADKRASVNLALQLPHNPHNPNNSNSPSTTATSSRKVGLVGRVFSIVKKKKEKEKEREKSGLSVQTKAQPEPEKPVELPFNIEYVITDEDETGTECTNSIEDRNGKVLEDVIDEKFSEQDEEEDEDDEKKLQATDAATEDLLEENTDNNTEVYSVLLDAELRTLHRRESELRESIQKKTKVKELEIREARLKARLQKLEIKEIRLQEKQLKQKLRELQIRELRLREQQLLQEALNQEKRRRVAQAIAEREREREREKEKQREIIEKQQQEMERELERERKEREQEERDRKRELYRQKERDREKQRASRILPNLDKSLPEIAQERIMNLNKSLPDISPLIQQSSTMGPGNLDKTLPDTASDAYPFSASSSYYSGSLSSQSLPSRSSSGEINRNYAIYGKTNHIVSTVNLYTIYGKTNHIMSTVNHDAQSAGSSSESLPEPQICDSLTHSFHLNLLAETLQTFTSTGAKYGIYQTSSRILGESEKATTKSEASESTKLLALLQAKKLQKQQQHIVMNDNPSSNSNKANINDKDDFDNHSNNIDNNTDVQTMIPHGSPSLSKRNDSSPRSTLSGNKRDDYIKIKIYSNSNPGDEEKEGEGQNEIHAMKISKSELGSLDVLVHAIQAKTVRASDLDPNQVKLSIVSKKAKSFTSVNLTPRKGARLNSQLIMGYIQAKDKIYVRADYST